MDQRSLEDLTLPMYKGEQFIEDESEIQHLNDELEKLENEEKWIDSMIDNVKGQLEEMANDLLYEKYAYVTYDDIKQLNKDQDQTLLAI